VNSKLCSTHPTSPISPPRVTTTWPFNSANFAHTITSISAGVGTSLRRKEWPAPRTLQGTERIGLIAGKKILLVDFSNCPAHEVEKIARAAPDYITVQPRGSVLVLTDLTGAAFDPDALRAMKETAVFDKPFVKKSALIGTEVPWRRWSAAQWLPVAGLCLGSSARRISH